MPREREYDDRHFEDLAKSLAEGNRPYLDTNEAEEFIDYLLGKERRDEALAASDYAVSLHQNDSGLLIQRATILVEYRRLEEARNILQYVSPLEQRNPDLHIAWGDLHVQDGDVIKGLECYDEAVACEPEDSDSYFETLLMIASRLNRDDQWQYVFKYVDQYLNKKPHDPDILFERAYAEEKCGEDAKCMETYLEMLQFNPFSDMAWYNYALVCTRNSLFENANQAFTRAIALAPDFADAYCNYGNMWASWEKYDKAIEQYAQYVSRAKGTDTFDASVYELMGDCLFNWGVSEREILEKDEKNTIPGFYYVALTPEVRKLFGNAIEFYKLCIDNKYNESRAWMQIADTTSLLGDNKKGLELMDKAIKLEPTIPGVYYMKSALYEREGDNQKTLQVLLEGITYDINAVRPWLEVTKLIFKMPTEEGQDQLYNFRQVKSRFPAEPSIVLAEAFMIYLIEKDDNLAYRMIESVKKQYPESFCDAYEDTDFYNMMQDKPFNELI